MSESIKRLESVMSLMGYDKELQGHKTGEPDAAFKVAFEKAVVDLQRITFYDDVKSGKFKPAYENYDAEQGKIFKQKMAEKLTESFGQKLEAMKAYSEGKRFWAGRIEINVEEELKNNGFQGALLEPKNVKGVIAFMQGANQYVDDITAVKEELKKAPVVTTGAFKTDDPLARMKPIKEETPPSPPPSSEKNNEQASEELEQAEAVKKIQSLSGVQQTGTYDEETQKAIIAKTKSLQESAPGWKGQKDGIYTPQFEAHLRSLSGAGTGVYAAFAAGMSELRKFEIEAPKAEDAARLNSSSRSSARGAAAPLPVPSNIPPEKIEGASRAVEIFLKQATDAIREKKESGILGVLFETANLPEPGTADGNFDSQDSLQAVLSMFQGPLGLTPGEIKNYTPAGTGKKIRDNFHKLESQMSKEARDAFNKQIGGKNGLVDSLDLLAQAGKLSGGKSYEGSPMNLSEAGKAVMGFLAPLLRMLGQAFPSVMPLVDGLIKAKTGGLGLNDLLPPEHKLQSLANPRYVNSPPHVQMELRYEDALKEAIKNKKPGETDAQVQKALHEQILIGQKVVDMIPINNSEAAKAAHGNALKEALAEAEKHRDNPGTAAQAFSITFHQKWAPHNPGLSEGEREDAFVKNEERSIREDSEATHRTRSAIPRDSHQSVDPFPSRVPGGVPMDDGRVNPTGDQMVLGMEAVSDLKSKHYAALSGPTLMQDGPPIRKMIVMYIDDRLGWETFRDKPGVGVERALGPEGNKFFKTTDITREFKDFVTDFEKFCNSKQNKGRMRSMSLHDKLKDFEHHYEEDNYKKGPTVFEQKYPGMARIVLDPNPEKGMNGVHYGVGPSPLYKNINGARHADIIGLAEQLIQHGGPNLDKRLNSEGDHDKHENKGVKGNLKEKFGRKAHGEAPAAPEDSHSVSATADRKKKEVGCVEDGGGICGLDDLDVYVGGPSVLANGKIVTGPTPKAEKRIAQHRENCAEVTERCTVDALGAIYGAPNNRLLAPRA